MLFISSAAMKQHRPHLSLVMLSSLAFFLLIIFPDVSNTSSCSWEGQVSSDSSLFSNSLSLSNTDAVVHINNVVKRLQVHNLMPTNTVSNFLKMICPIWFSRSIYYNHVVITLQSLRSNRNKTLSNYTPQSNPVHTEKAVFESCSCIAFWRIWMLP